MTAHARVTWKDEYEATDGQGHGPADMRPADLLLVALARCSMADVISILRKKHQPLSRLEVVADGVQDADPPWRFRTIHLTFLVRGRNLTAEAVTRAIELSEGKYCSVAASLRPQVEITTSFEIQPAETEDEVEWTQGIPR